MAPRIGIKDVAREAGVSTTTVSHVLNEHPHARVTDETRQRVHAAAERLSYQPNRSARGLRTNSSEMVGLLTEEIAATPHAGRIILGAQEAATRHGLTLAIINSALQADAAERRNDVLALLDRQVDGILYATVYHDVVTPPEELYHVPCVLIGAADSRGVIPAVLPDERQGAKAAVQRLVSEGHERIAFVGNSIDVPATRGRRAGYVDGLTAAGLTVHPELLVEGPGEARAGYEAAQALLEVSDLPTAILSYNDRMAMGIYRALQEHGLRIPHDMSVMGFDNQAPIPESLFPGLTTVALPHYEMGVWAVDALAMMVKPDSDEQAPTGTVSLSCAVVERDSVAPPARR